MAKPDIRSYTPCEKRSQLRNLPPMAFFHQHDEQGEYVAYANVLKATIDATVSRLSCMHEMTNTLLYGGNTFYFAITSSHQEMCPPIMFKDKEHTVYHPNARKPFVKVVGMSFHLSADFKQTVLDACRSEVATGIQKLKEPKSKLINGRKITRSARMDVL